MSDAESRRQARERRPWPARVLPLEEAEPADLSATTTAEERLAMVWELSRRMWELTGRPLPDYSRSEMPITIIRGR